MAAGNIRVLLVEDDAVDRIAFERLVRSEHLPYDYVEAVSLQETLAALAKQKFDVIVCDYMLNDGTASDVLAACGDTPLIVVTGTGSEEIAAEMMKHGARDYLIKDPQGKYLTVLPPTVINAIERKAAEDELRKHREHLEQLVSERTAKLKAEIEARQRTEEALRRREDELRSALAAKDHFVSVVSHGLRTPLTPVLINASSLEADERLPRELRVEMALIRRNLELEVRLIDDLLDLNRIARGTLEIRKEPMDVHERVMNALEVCRTEAQEKGLTITCELSAARACIQGDGGRIQQVFWNLIGNAVKFTPHGGSVELRSWNPKPGRLSVEISDTGPGIEPQVLSRLFNAFEQGEPVKSPLPGIGLGLAIARALVEMHGGTLAGRSKGLGQGATFVVELPTIAASVRRPAAAPCGGVPQRILLVEDHAPSLYVLERALTRVGHHVKTAATLADALAIGESEEFDLLISDLGLPDGSGLDLVRQLHATRPNLIAMALSGYGTDEDIAKSKEAGFVEHLVKPVELCVLRATVDRLTGSPVAG
jgi:signal transduction histidine kinase